MVKHRSNRSIVLDYIMLAVGTAMIGIVITFVLVLAAKYYEIDIMKNLWLLAIPVTLSLFVNVLLLEMTRKFRRR